VTSISLLTGSAQPMEWSKSGQGERCEGWVKCSRAKYLSASPVSKFPTYPLMQILCKHVNSGHQDEISVLETILDSLSSKLPSQTQIIRGKAVPGRRHPGWNPKLITDPPSFSGFLCHVYIKMRCSQNDHEIVFSIPLSWFPKASQFSLVTHTQSTRIGCAFPTCPLANKCQGRDPTASRQNRIRAG
jgi:hypothetical protein